MNYHCDVLEAKIVLEESLVVRNEIKKRQKNISSELLESFGRLITEREDIFKNDARCAPSI